MPQNIHCQSFCSELRIRLSSFSLYRLQSILYHVRLLIPNRAQAAATVSHSNRIGSTSVFGRPNPHPVFEDTFLPFTASIAAIPSSQRRCVYFALLFGHGCPIFIENMMTMVINLYIELYRMVDIYCRDTADDSFNELPEEIKEVLYRIIDSDDQGVNRQQVRVKLLNLSE